MAKFDNIIIVSDIDGTFLGKESRMVDKNVEAVKYFTQNGGKFTFVTGRNPVELKKMIPLSAELANIPVGCCNGIHLCNIDTMEIMHDELLDKETIFGIYKRVLSEENRNYQMLMVHGSEFYAFTDEEFDFVKDYPESCHKITLDSAQDVELNKIVLFGDPALIDGVAQNILSLFKEKVDCVRSLPIAREFVPKGKVKNVAVEQLMSKYPDCTLFAVGDYENDFEMLSVAHHSVCPANALDSVKKLCDIHVCDHDEGAIADLIHIIEEKYIG